jgi:hypothetical protein
MGSSSTEGRQIETIESGKTSMGDKNEKINCNYGKLYGITMVLPCITRKLPLRRYLQLQTNPVMIGF